MVVYEGYQTDYKARSRSPLTTLGVEEESNESNSFIDNHQHSSNSYLDLDHNQESLSGDYHHDDVNQSTLHRVFGEAAARGAKNATGL